MKTTHVLSLLFLLNGLLISIGCQPARNIVPELDTEASKLPLLAEGQHLGMIVGFNPSNPTATEDSIAARWQESLDAGSTAGRLQIDWPELEPAPGEFDEEALRGPLQEMVGQGLATFLTISAFDSDGAVVPEDLEGVDFDSEEMQTRFNALMDWVIPMLVQYDGWAIAVANEPDVNFEDNRQLADEILMFLEQSRDHIHQLDKDMAVTITMSAGTLDDFPRQTRKIAAASDVVSLNFYGISPKEAGQIVPAETVQAKLQELLEFAGDKDIVFQELGLHSGGENLTDSPENQAAFFQATFEMMEREPRFRAAYVFQLVDWSPEVADLFMSLFDGEDVPSIFIEEYREVLLNLGLIRYEDGTRKPAWDVYIDWVKKIR
ncbi:MAG: hypothetical protein AAF399_16645 [Bacteroidota bacterium]